MAKDLKGTKTHQNLKDAFAGESQANRRYLYFAKVADIEGYPEIAGNFRETADGETGHAHGHLDYLKTVGDPATGLPLGDTSLNLKAASRVRPTSTPTCTRAWPRRARRGLHRGRRLVRDAREGREVARRPLPEAARRHRLDDPDRAAGGRSLAAPPPACFPSLPQSRGPVTIMATTIDKPVFLQADRRALLRPDETSTGTGRRSSRRSRAVSSSAMAAACASSTATASRCCSGLLDRKHEGDVRKITEGETDRIMDACFQCKLCEVQCPYTPREKHEFQFDFPKLVHRYKAQRAKRRGIRCATASGPPRRRGRPGAPEPRHGERDEPGQAQPHRDAGDARHPQGQAAARLRSHHVRELGRARRPCPERSLGRRGGAVPTCYVQNNEPQIGRDTLFVLDRNRIPTACIKGLQCCGMPAWETGDLDTVRRQRRTT